VNKKGHICAADGGYSPTRADVIDAHNSIRWPGTLVHGDSCRHAAVFMIVWVATACSVGVRPAFCPETCYFLVIEHALEAIGSKAKKAASKAPKSNDDNYSKYDLKPWKTVHFLHKSRAKFGKFMR
jgi:hypothetical protein